MITAIHTVACWDSSTSSVHISIVGVTVGGEGWRPGGSRADWDRSGLRTDQTGGHRLPARGAVQVYIKRAGLQIQHLQSNKSSSPLLPISLQSTDWYTRDRIYRLRQAQLYTVLTSMMTRLNIYM